MTDVPYASFASFASEPQFNLQEELKFLRIRSKKHEIMIAPDGNYTLLVIQKPAVS